MLLYFWVSEIKGAKIYFGALPPVQKVWHPNLVWVWGYLVRGGFSFRSWSLKANLDLKALVVKTYFIWITVMSLPLDRWPLATRFYLRATWFAILLAHTSQLNLKIQFTKNTDFVGLNLKKFQAHSGKFSWDSFGQNLNLLVNFSIWKIKRGLISVQSPKC